MKNVPFFLILFMLLFTVASFGLLTQLTEEGEKVKYVKNQEAPANCVEVGIVSSGFIQLNMSENELMKQLRNKTANLGGNFLVVESVEASDATFKGKGIAYKCQ